MDFKTGRVNHIEDILCGLHSGHWYHFSDPNNRIYENIVLNDGINYEIPTKEFLESELQRKQDEFDVMQYKRNRIKGVSGSYAASQGTGSMYPPIGEQFDMLYHELTASGSLTMSGSWYKTITRVKEANPKP